MSKDTLKAARIDDLEYAILVGTEEKVIKALKFELYMLTR
jgi:hypothetical protein